MPSEGERVRPKANVQISESDALFRRNALRCDENL